MPKGPEAFGVPLQEGQKVKSEILNLGALPESFPTLSEESEPNWVVGVGLLITPEGFEKDSDLERFFTHLSAPMWNPEHLATHQDKAIQDIVERIVADYRASEMYQANPNVPHQIYGEISRRSVSPKPVTELSEYDDAVPHVDFVPPEHQCRGYFFSDNNPTEFFEGEFTYKGNLEHEYGLKTDHPGLSPAPDNAFPSGQLYVTPDARTLIHRSNIVAPANRTFGRMFIDLKR